MCNLNAAAGRQLSCARATAIVQNTILVKQQKLVKI